MKIGSVSIVVPTNGCVNKCMFCVSRMHENKYENVFDSFQIEKRIKWAVQNKVNTCIITGTGEALQNTFFLNKLVNVFEKMNYPFPNVELQTTGVMLTSHVNHPVIENKLVYTNINLLKKLGVNTISISISDPFNDENNMNIIGVSEKLKYNLQELCYFIKDQGFNLRLSLNMTNVFDNTAISFLLMKLRSFEADQLTFRKLFHNNDNSFEQTKWVKENACKEDTIKNINDYIIENGKPLYMLPFGAIAYSINGMSVVIDSNCMSKNEYKKLKYVILRENGKLYSQWDDNGSLIF